jgi:hypothetical protein
MKFLQSSSGTLKTENCANNNKEIYAQHNASTEFANFACEVH